MSRGRVWAARIALVLAGIVVSVLALELGLRLTPFRRVLPPPPAAVYGRFDPETVVDIRENVPPMRFGFYDDEHDVWSNELGCFDRPFGGEPNYILLVGDSFTFGFAAFERKWGTIVEDILKVRVLKCGVIGHGTRQELIKAERVVARIKRSPRLIIVGYFINDVTDDYKVAHMRVTGGEVILPALDPTTGALTFGDDSSPRAERIAAWLAAHSVSYGLTKHAVKAALIDLVGFKKARAFGVAATEPALGKYDWLDNAYDEHVQSIVGFKRLAERLHAKLFFVSIPTKEQVYPSLGVDDDVDMAKAHRRVRSVLERGGVDSVDLLPLFMPYTDRVPGRVRRSANDLYWTVDRHWNLRGNRLAALFVARHILLNHLVPVEGRAEKLAAVERELKALLPKAATVSERVQQAGARRQRGDRR